MIIKKIRTTKQLRKALELFFAKGAIVKSYGRAFDKVLEFDWNNGNWYVQVQGVLANGLIDPKYPNPRIHKTRPTNVELLNAYNK